MDVTEPGGLTQELIRAGRRAALTMLQTYSHSLRREAAHCLTGTIALASVTVICFRLRLNLATTTCLYLTIIVLLSLRGCFLASIVVSLIGVGCLA
jgi:hypothetical protein